MHAPDLDERTRRLHLLLALEVQRIVRDLLERQEFLLAMWSRHRTREPFLDSTFTRWRTVSLGDLALLDEPTIVTVQRFYEELEAFRLYVRHTEHMPMTMTEQFFVRLERLAERGDAAVEALGGVPEQVPFDSIPLPIPPPPPVDLEAE